MDGPQNKYYGKKMWNGNLVYEAWLHRKVHIPWISVKNSKHTVFLKE